MPEILIDVGVGAIRYAKFDIEGMEPRVLRAFFAAWPKKHWPEWIQVEDVLRQRIQGEASVTEVLIDAGYSLKHSFEPDRVFCLQRDQA